MSDERCVAVTVQPASSILKMAETAENVFWAGLTGTVYPGGCRIIVHHGPNGNANASGRPSDSPRHAQDASQRYRIRVAISLRLP